MVYQWIPHCAAMIGHPDGMAAHEKCFVIFGKEKNEQGSRSKERKDSPTT